MSKQRPSVPTDSKFDKFLEAFLDALVDDKFSVDGNLSEYLKKGADARSNDEANIVDQRIVFRLIKALGYADGEVDYNQQKGRLRPDFKISIKEYPRPACFIVEDKNTTIVELRSHRPQLQSYMTQSSASRGMLVNGHVILVYDQMEGEMQTPAVEIPLATAVEAWKGEGLLVQGKKKVAALEAIGLLASFAALWQRFRRDNFAGLTGLIEDLTLQNANGNNSPHKPDGKTWTNTYSRIHITPVTSDNADLLTEAIKGLIGEFEDDANAQLSAIERDYDDYERAATRIPSETTSLFRQEDSLVNTAMQLMARQDAETKEEDAKLLRLVMRGEILASELKQVERRIYGLHNIRTGKGTEHDPIFAAMSRIRAHTAKRYRYISKLQAQHKESIKVVNYFNTWKEKTASTVFQSEDSKLLRSEFLAQTAYLVIIRILLVRIMEDKGLVNRMFTNGGISLWFRDVESHYLEHAIGLSTGFLLDLAYTSAQHIYAHFFSERTVLDWYVPDRNAVIRVLHKLAGFDLSEINRDIIGTVYNQYVEAKHKHESGMYFTPPNIVSFMLDRIGYKGSGIIGKRLLDLSCGSGGFIVEAATRLVDAYREYWKAQGHSKIPANEIQAILDEIRDCLHGVDLNPFACSLAETNLLIQVMDLFIIAYKAKDKQAVSIDRFHIYNSDSLSFSPDTLISQAGTLPFPDDDLPVEDQLKAGLGRWREKFDFVVGNPPYVKANENAGLTEYRKRLKEEYPSDAVRATMVDKWDMFVPFVAASLNLLKQSDDDTAGKMAVITSNAIETVPYCEALRNYLASNSTVDEIHFFPEIKLFADAAVYNTITVATKKTPSGQAHTERFWHKTSPKHGTLAKAATQKLRQSQYKTGIFRQTLPELELAPSVKRIPLGQLYYLTKGMVLHAEEKNYKGQFTVDDLVVDLPDVNHPVAYSGSKDVDYFGLRNVKYLEYGENTRVPAQVSRPTFPELYDRPKLMVAEFGGFAYDDGHWDAAGFIKCNHSVFILIPWHQLKGVENRAINSEVKDLKTLRSTLESESAKVDPWYALAFLNSKQMRTLLDGVNRSAIAGRLQPDDLRQLSLPFPDDMDIVKQISHWSKQASDIQRSFLPLRKSGWKIEEDGVQAPAVVPNGIATLSLDHARVKWNLKILLGDAKVHALTRNGHRLFVGKKTVAELPSSKPEDALEWLCRQLFTCAEGTTVSQAVSSKLEVPETPILAAKALAGLTKDEKTRSDALLKIQALRENISNALDSLFVKIQHPKIT
jgi:hypothetical protein